MRLDCDRRSGVVADSVDAFKQEIRNPDGDAAFLFGMDVFGFALIDRADHIAVVGGIRREQLLVAKRHDAFRAETLVAITGQLDEDKGEVRFFEGDAPGIDHRFETRRVNMAALVVGFALVKNHAFDCERHNRP